MALSRTLPPYTGYFQPRTLRPMLCYSNDRRNQDGDGPGTRTV